MQKQDCGALHHSLQYAVLWWRIPEKGISLPGHLLDKSATCKANDADLLGELFPFGETGLQFARRAQSRSAPHRASFRSQGMALFCVVPTTLSSGVTMVTQARVLIHHHGQ